MATRGSLNDGERLGGKYVVERLLAQGGMGEVYLAQHEVLGEPVAIKVLLAQYLHHDEALARFLNEAKAAAKIKSEHVARVTDVAVSDRGMPYIVMEYLEGDDLERVIQKGGAMSPSEAVDAVLQSLDAVAQAHALGMVHRDLKPSNLFQARLPDGSTIVKVLDFGISKAATTASGKLTGTSSMLGSPMYTAPEQLRNARNATARSDVWSLGVILFELMSVRLPYEGETLGELIVTMMEREPTPLQSVAPEVPPGLVDVVMRCLRRVDTERFESVRELASALEPFAPPGGRGMGVARRLAAASPQFGAAGVASVAEPRQPTMTEWSRSHGTPALPLKHMHSALPWAGAAALLMVAGGAFLLRSGAPSSGPQLANARSAALEPAPALIVLTPVPGPVPVEVAPVAPPTPSAALGHDAGTHAPAATAAAAAGLNTISSPSRRPVPVAVPATHENPVPPKPKASRPAALPPGTSSRK